MDRLTTEQRSRNMANIKSRNTKPEIAVRKFLFLKGFRFRLNVKKLPGTPDIVLPKHRTVIFVHGCFWHGHVNCKKASIPKTRTDWWSKKISTNVANDKKALSELKKMGWHVISIWTCQHEDEWKSNLLSKLRF